MWHQGGRGFSKSDAERRKLETALQQLNAERKRLSKEVAARRGRGESSVDLEDRVDGLLVDRSRMLLRQGPK